MCFSTNSFFILCKKIAEDFSMSVLTKSKSADEDLFLPPQQESVGIFSTSSLQKIVSEDFRVNYTSSNDTACGLISPLQETVDGERPSEFVTGVQFMTPRINLEDTVNYSMNYSKDTPHCADTPRQETVYGSRKNSLVMALSMPPRRNLEAK